METGSADEAMRQLDALKAHRLPLPGVDHLRAVGFIKSHDILQARQALLEELRNFPAGSPELGFETQALLQRVEAKLDAYLALPELVVTAHPLFAMVYDGIRSRSMLHWARLLSLYIHAKALCENDVPGDFVECGVAGGGSTIVLGVVIQHFSRRPRKLFACDTFAGMPEPTVNDRRVADAAAADSTRWSTGTCACPEWCVQRLVSSFGLEDVIELRKGRFEETLPSLVQTCGANSGSDKWSIAMMHLDADWYDSTLCALRNLYPCLHPQGVLQIDDYHYWGGCQKAVTEYFAAQPPPPPLIEEIDGNAVLIRPHTAL